MPDQHGHTFRFRILRYTPNLIRDEWVNIGVLLEDVNGFRRAIRVADEDAEIARIRRLHPGADENLLRALPAEFEARLRGTNGEVTGYLDKLDQTLSNSLQLSPQTAILADDFDTELDRIFRERVARPAYARGSVTGNIREWIRNRLQDVFQRHGILRKLNKSVRVDEFTEPGDPMHIDYGYRFNGTRGYIQTLPLRRDPTQAKVLAYTAESIRKKAASSEFTAITEIDPAPENPRHQFVSQLLKKQDIKVVPLNHIEKFAEDLKQRLEKTA